MARAKKTAAKKTAAKKMPRKGMQTDIDGTRPQRNAKVDRAYRKYRDNVGLWKEAENPVKKSKSELEGVCDAEGIEFPYLCEDGAKLDNNSTFVVKPAPKKADEG